MEVLETIGFIVLGVLTIFIMFVTCVWIIKKISEVLNIKGETLALALTFLMVLVPICYAIGHIIINILRGGI